MIPPRKKIDLATYVRRGLLEAFKDRQMPCFSTTCNVDITRFKPFADAQGHGFLTPVSYAISRTVNGIAEFRHCLINGELYEFEKVDPGFTVLLEDNTFSFCDSRYFEDFKEYSEYAARKIASVKFAPDVSTPEKDHMFFISSIPWFSFTSFTHPFDAGYASLPIFTIGKYFKQGDSLLMPLAVQVHHDLIDGFHAGLFYNSLGNLLNNPGCILSKPLVSTRTYHFNSGESNGKFATPRFGRIQSENEVPAVPDDGRSIRHGGCVVPGAAFLPPGRQRTNHAIGIARHTRQQSIRPALCQQARDRQGNADWQKQSHPGDFPAKR